MQNSISVTTLRALNKDEQAVIQEALWVLANYDANLCMHKAEAKVLLDQNFEKRLFWAVPEGGVR